MALVAVGGYGRAELCPSSDIDVMLVHDRRSDIAKVADRIWYPIWDAGLHLGHSVCTVREALGAGRQDLDTATALLSARHVAGDEELSSKLLAAAPAAWEKRSRRWLTELAKSVESRHERAGEVAFQLEPDLKEGRGGLRDVHALHWAEAARSIMLEYDRVEPGGGVRRAARRPGGAAAAHRPAVQQCWSPRSRKVSVGRSGGAGPTA